MIRVSQSTAAKAAGSLTAGFWGQGALAVSGVLAARLLGPENRGYFALIVLWPVALVALAGLGLPTALTYFVARDLKDARLALRAVAVPAAVQVTVATVAHALVLAVLLAGKPPEVRIAGAISLFGVPSLLGLEYALALLQGQRRYKDLNILRVLPATLYASFVLLMFATRNGMLPLVTTGWVVSYMVTVSIAAAAVFRIPREPATRFPPLTEMLRFGISGFLGSFSLSETFRLDQAVVGLFLSPLALGLYVVGLAFTNLPRFVAQSVGLVAYPVVATQPDRILRRSLIWRFVLLAALPTGGVVLSLELTVGRLLPAFFGPNFMNAVPITQALLVGALFLSVRRVLGDCARGAGYPVIGSIAEAASWAILVPALLVLTPSHGTLGVGIAFALSGAASLVLTTVLVISTERSASTPGSDSSAPITNDPGMRGNPSTPTLDVSSAEP